jgi:RNA polymerase sigma factor for flagellar operon FliA
MSRKPSELVALSPEQQALIDKGVLRYTLYLASCLGKKYGLTPSEQQEIYGIGTDKLSVIASQFNRNRGVKFISYASHRVKGSMLDHIRHTRGWRRKTRGYEIPISAYTNLAHLFYGGKRTKVTEDPALDLEDLAWLKDKARPDYDPVHQAEQQKLLRKLSEVFDQLKPLERTVIVLYYFEGKTLEEIGREIHKGKPWVSKLHHRALTALRTLLDPPTAHP